MPDCREGPVYHYFTISFRATKERGRLRTENLRLFLYKLMSGRTSEFMNFNTLTFENIKRGIGETWPDQGITDYKGDDERRRIVWCYRRVLPNN